MVKSQTSILNNRRGRKQTHLTLLSASFLKKNGKLENPEKFADDKARKLALEFTKSAYLPHLGKSCAAKLKTIISMKKEKTHKKSTMVIKAISVNQENWKVLEKFFKEPSDWKDCLEVVLKIKYNDSDANKEKIFTELVDELFIYLRKKSFKNKEDLSMSDNSSDNNSTTDESLIIKDSGENNVLDCFDSDSYYSVDDFLYDDPQSRKEGKRKQPLKTFKNYNIVEDFNGHEEHQIVKLSDNSFSCNFIENDFKGAEGYKTNIYLKECDKMILDPVTFSDEEKKSKHSAQN